MPSRAQTRASNNSSRAVMLVILLPVCTENSDADVVVMQSTEESM
jgi:hypothetical protein